MNLTSKKTSLLILAITAIVGSKMLFLFFNDPEGPNLVVVLGTALILYCLSLTSYLFAPSATGTKKLLLSIFIQLLLVVIFYVVM